VTRDWLQRKSLKVGEKNVQHPALAEWHKILLLPLNIKLGLMKNFVKAKDRTGLAFSSIWLKFSLSSAKQKLKRGSSDPQALQRRYVQQPTSG